MTGSVESSASSNVPLSLDFSSEFKVVERECSVVEEGGEGSPGRASKIETANVPDLRYSMRVRSAHVVDKGISREKKSTYLPFPACEAKTLRFSDRLRKDR